MQRHRQICSIPLNLPLQAKQIHAGYSICRSHLGSFGISGDLALQAMYTLSGGQKSRVAFAKVLPLLLYFLLLHAASIFEEAEEQGGVL